MTDARPAARTILHLDMDAFFAAVEQRDRPELRGKPVVIGADPQGGRGRGVVSTASYEARRFGVGSAMPISQAWRLCPHAVYLHPDIDKYAGESKLVMEILRRVTDVVEPVSIDEAFLDVTGSARAMGDGATIARRLKDAIRAERQLTASVGVASSKLVAKIASDMQKPDGLVVVPAGEEAAFLAPLPVRRLWGVGPKMEEQLAKLGVVTIGDLAALDPARLERRLGTHGQDLQRLARGEDDRPVAAEPAGAKSLGQEHTYGRDTADAGRLRATLLSLADTVAARLRAHGLRARTSRSSTATRTSTRRRTRARCASRPTPARCSSTSRGRSSPTCTGPGGACASSGSTRRTSATSARSCGLFDAPAEPAPLDRVRDAVVKRFGDEAITRASLLGRRERRNPSDKPPR